MCLLSVFCCPDVARDIKVKLHFTLKRLLYPRPESHFDEVNINLTVRAKRNLRYTSGSGC